MEPRDLPRQLGADRPSRARHHHDPAAEPFLQARAVQNHRIPADQVIELHVPDRRQLRSATDEIVVRRDGQRLDTDLRAELGNPPPHAVRCRRKCNDHLADAESLAPQRQLGNRPQHADVAQQPSLLGGVIVEQSNDAPLAAVGELLGQASPGFARAENQDRLAQRGKRAVEPMLFPDAVGKAAPRHEQNQDRRVQDEHTARHDGSQPQHHQHHGDGDRAQTHREHDPLQVREAREPPETAIEAESEKNARLQGQDPGERSPDVRNLRLVPLQVESQPIKTHPGDGRGDHVMGECQPGPPVSPYFHHARRSEPLQA